jgi:glycosyltransferase involved in cell wall biosynthesis
VKIVFLNPSSELGGAETALIELLAALRSTRPAWSLNLVTPAPGPLISRASSLGVSSASLPFPSSLASVGEWGQRGSTGGRLRLVTGIAAAAVPTFVYERTLRRHLRAIGPHIVHTNGLKMHILGARCGAPHAKLVWHLHDYPESRPLSAKLLRRYAGRCAAIVANSESVAQQAARLAPRGVHVRTIHNAVDLNRFTPDGPRVDLDALAGVPPLAPHGVRIGLVGTFARWKGHDVFFQALQQLRVTVPFRGYVIGDSIYQTAASQYSMAELRDTSARMGLNGKIAFTGRIEDVPAAIRALDIVVHASVEPEPFGLVIAEAMACARPVVVSRAGGAVEIAQAGAVFHTPGDATELAAVIAQLASSDSERAALGSAGRDAALRLFGRDRLAAALVSLYEGLL